MISRLGIIVSVLAMLFCAGCARRILIEIDDVSPLLENLDDFYPEIISFKGFGQITFCEKGVRQSGRIDALWNYSDSFSASIYSPFGTTVASVKGDESGGKVSFDEQEMLFGIDDNLGVLPFPWGKNITFSQVMRYFTGRMPRTSVINRAPDSLSLQGDYAKAKWFDNSFNVIASISRFSEELESIEYQFSSDGQEPWNVQFSNFNHGLAGEIKIEEDSRNYILIRYSEISADQVRQ